MLTGDPGVNTGVGVGTAVAIGVGVAAILEYTTDLEEPDSTPSPWLLDALTVKLYEVPMDR